MSEFDRFANHYEDLLNSSLGGDGSSAQYFAQAKARYAKRLLSANPPHKMLDFGCGVGLLAQSLALEFPAAALDGFDVSASSIGSVSPALRERGLFTDDPAQLRKPYDVVVVANVMHHIAPADRPAMVAHMATQLTPGGLLLFFEHNPLNPVTRRVVAQCPFDDGVVLLRPAELATYAMTAGLNVERRAYLTFFPAPLRALLPLEQWLHWLPLGAQYALVARRPT